MRDFYIVCLMAHYKQRLEGMTDDELYAIVEEKTRALGLTMEQLERFHRDVIKPLDPAGNNVTYFPRQGRTEAGD